MALSKKVTNEFYYTLKESVKSLNGERRSWRAADRLRSQRLQDVK
jgi:hypothetical protein